jgi:hypothetical protein
MERTSRLIIRSQRQGMFILSESIVSPQSILQADQDSSPVHNLAARTVAHLKARDSPEENTTSDDRDEVSGPLRSAPGVDGIVDIDDAFEEEVKEQEGAWTHKVKREHLEQTKVRRFL